MMKTLFFALLLATSVSSYDELVIQVSLTPSGSSLPTCSSGFDQQLSLVMSNWTSAAVANYSANLTIGALFGTYGVSARRTRLLRESKVKDVPLAMLSGIKFRRLPTSPGTCPTCSSSGCRQYCYAACNLCAKSRRRQLPALSSSYTSSSSPSSNTSSSSPSSNSSSSSSSNSTSSASNSSSTLNFSAVSSSTSSAITSYAVSWLSFNDQQGCLGNPSLVTISVTVTFNNGTYNQSQFNSWFGV